MTVCYLGGYSFVLLNNSGIAIAVYKLQMSAIQEYITKKNIYLIIFTLFIFKLGIKLLLLLETQIPTSTWRKK